MKPKVLLGMSGGVDSSVSAILLQKQGYEVIGVTMKLWGPDEIDTASDDAKKVCDKLGIEHHTINYKDLFKENVIDYFIDEYRNCRTPNPCVKCNKYLKFGAMIKLAEELGADYFATGHYAKTEFNKEYNRTVIKKANNIKKDQSYVLYTIPSEILSEVLFPLGEFESKDEVRKVAQENGLVVASKPDSEDICFIPDGDYKKFLEENSELKQKEGNIVDKNGKVLGKHNGLYNYTIGQRKGLGISNKVPLFVNGFNIERNEVIVGEQEELYKKELYVKDYNLQLIDELEMPMDVLVKIRYSSKEEKAKIEKMNNNTIKVTFENKVKSITPGQSAVFYIDDMLLGGGIII